MGIVVFSKYRIEENNALQLYIKMMVNTDIHAKQSPKNMLAK